MTDPSTSPVANLVPGSFESPGCQESASLAGGTLTAYFDLDQLWAHRA